jgi:hypothetical protein
VYKKLEKKNFTVMHCWLKLNVQPKWNLFIAKTTAQATEGETGDPTDPTQESPKKVIRFLPGKKWEEERAKREGAMAKLTERFEDILSKKEETCLKCSDLKEEKKAKRFKLLIEATDKKFKLEERRTMIKERKAALEEKKLKITTNADDAKMLTLNLDAFDADARMIVQSVCYPMLQWQEYKLIAVDNEAEADAEAAYAVTTTP